MLSCLKETDEPSRLVMQRPVELLGGGSEQPGHLERTLSSRLSYLQVVEQAPSFQLLCGFTQTWMGFGGSAVFESSMFL